MPMTDADKIRFQRQVFGVTLTPADVARLRDTLPFLERISKSLNDAFDAFKPWVPSGFGVKYLLDQIDECGLQSATPAATALVATSAPIIGTGKPQTVVVPVPPRPTPKPAEKRPGPPKGKTQGGVSGSILAALKQHPDGDLDALCKDVYGATSSKVKGRMLAMLRFLAGTGRVRRVSQRQYVLAGRTGGQTLQGSTKDRKAMIAAAAQKVKPTAPAPRSGTKESYPASVKAAAARKAGREPNASPTMFRCNVCAGLMFERQRVEHMLGAHGVAIEEHEAAKYFKLVEDRSE